SVSPPCHSQPRLVRHPCRPSPTDRVDGRAKGRCGMSAATSATGEMEEVESFRSRARRWIQGNLRPVPTTNPERMLRRVLNDEEELAAVLHDRQLQRMLFDAGFAGICFPRVYGGQGLSPAHQRALNEELVGYEYPARVQVPTFSPCAAVLLEFGN